MITTINNDWITLSEKRNGVDVQRKFSGLDTRINLDNTVRHCHVYYQERELYPNGEVIKTEEKYYSLEDLAPQDCEVEDKPYYMEALAVLTGFIEKVGNPFIINASRGTISNLEVLPLNVENGYPLKRDTRDKLPKEN